MMESSEFRRLYDAYYPDVLRFVNTLEGRYTREADIDEMLQDVFIKIAMKANQFRGQAQLKTWIFAIARNTVADHARQTDRAKRRRNLLGEQAVDAGEMLSGASGHTVGSLAERMANPELAVLHAESKELVRACIDKLPLQMKSVVVCRLILDLTIAETAEVMQWSDGRVRVTYQRALRKFRRIWENSEQ